MGVTAASVELPGAAYRTGVSASAWMAGSRGNEQRPLGGYRVAGAGSWESPRPGFSFARQSQAVGGSPVNRLSTATPPCVTAAGVFWLGLLVSRRLWFEDILRGPPATREALLRAPRRPLTRSDVVLVPGPWLQLGPVPGSSRQQSAFPHRTHFKLYN